MFDTHLDVEEDATDLDAHESEAKGFELVGEVAPEELDTEDAIADQSQATPLTLFILRGTDGTAHFVLAYCTTTHRVL